MRLPAYLFLTLVITLGALPLAHAQSPSGAAGGIRPSTPPLSSPPSGGLRPNFGSLSQPPASSSFGSMGQPTPPLLTPPASRGATTSPNTPMPTAPSQPPGSSDMGGILQPRS